jgi:PEGA domain
MTYYKRVGVTLVAAAAILGMGLGAPSQAEARAYGHAGGAFHGGGGFHGGGHFHGRGHFGFSPFVGFGFGPFWGPWGYYGWWGPWGGFGPYPYPYAYPYAEEGASFGYAMMSGFGAVDLNVKPNQAEVWVDGNAVGEARDFDGSPTYMWLKAGDHDIQVYKGGYVTFAEKVNVRAGVKTELKVRLEKGVSEPPTSKPKPPQAE